MSLPGCILVWQVVLTQTGLACFSFIRYLLGQDFPNQRIGPEPTTDRFVSVMYVVFKPFVCCLAAPSLDVLSIMSVYRCSNAGMAHIAESSLAMLCAQVYVTPTSFPASC